METNAHKMTNVLQEFALDFLQLYAQLLTNVMQPECAILLLESVPILLLPMELLVSTLTFASNQLHAKLELALLLLPTHAIHPINAR